MDDNGTAETTGKLETWVGNFGSPGERKGGLRRLHFREDLGDVGADVSLCLGVLPLIVEKVSSEAFCQELSSGFYIITSLICEAAQNTIGALEAERRVAAQEHVSVADKIKELRDEKARTEQVMAAISGEIGARVNGIEASVGELAGKG